MTDPQKIPFEALEAQAAANGWGFFDGPLAARAEAEKRMRSSRGERAALIAAMLAEAPQFVELMEFLADETLRRVDFVSGLGVDPMQAYAFGVFREGQKAMLLSIFKLIADGRGHMMKGREP